MFTFWANSQISCDRLLEEVIQREHWHLVKLSKEEEGQKSKSILHFKCWCFKMFDNQLSKRSLQPWNYVCLFVCCCCLFVYIICIYNSIYACLFVYLFHVSPVLVCGVGISRLPVTRRWGSNNEKQQIHSQSIEEIHWKVKEIWYTRSLWALRARLLVGGPSGLLTHYPTANTLSTPWIVC